MNRTSNPATVETKHLVSGHLAEDRRWYMECDTDGWTLVTDPDVSDDDLDALVDGHLES